MEEDDEEGSGMITTFLLSQIHCFTKMVIDGPTEEPTDGRTDKASYRDAWTHLKTTNYELWHC